MTQSVSFTTDNAGIPVRYERYFVPLISRPLADDLLAAAAPGTGDLVLDIGCGTGIVARQALDAVGPRGRVVGVDTNPGMLAVAEQLEERIEWFRSGAEALPLPDASVDLALAQLSLQFMSDRPAALRDAHRVLRPGGRIVLNVVGPMPELFCVLQRALARHIGPPAAGFVGTVFALHDIAELRELLAAAGFGDVDVAARTVRLALPAPIDFLMQYLSSTPLALAMAGAGDPVREALEREVTAGWQPFTRTGGMDLSVRVVTAMALR